MKKKLLYLLVVLSLFMVVGCSSKKDNNESDTELDEDEYSITIGRSVTINDDLVISVESVSDSRCPEDVECYWQGELEYSILINGEYDKISTVLTPKIELSKYVLSIVGDKCSESTLIIKVEKI